MPEEPQFIQLRVPTAREAVSWLRTPAIVALTVLATAFGQRYLDRERSVPAPAPVSPEDAGKAYIPHVADAYAAKLLTMRDAILKGDPIDEAERLGVEAERATRAETYARFLKPLLDRQAPDGSPVTPEGRAGVAEVLRRIALGLSPGRNAAPNPPPPQPPQPQAESEPAARPTGWLDDPDGRQRLLSTFKARSLQEAAPDFFRPGPSRDDPEDVYLYRAWKEVLGDYPSYPAQQIGDCTSFGSAHAIDLLQCIDIALYKLDKSSYEETCSEAIYGFGREIAGMLGSWGDGCYGVAVAKGLTQYGAVSRKFVGPYKGSRARQWGSGAGVPQEVRQEASKHLLGEAVLVTTLAEADASLNNGYPFIVCSMQGFTMQRDETGTCYPRGRWAHCMFVAGRRKLGGNRVQYLICQSWGPSVPSGPLSDDQPSFSFWADAGVVARMLAAGDSLAFSRFAGFSKRSIPQKWRHSAFSGDKEAPAQKESEKAPTRKTTWRLDAYDTAARRKRAA